MNTSPAPQTPLSRMARALRRWRAAAVVLGAGLVAVTAIESRLPARLSGALRPRTFPWKEPGGEVLGVVQAETRLELASLPEVTRAARLRGSRLEGAVRGWRSSRRVNTWPNACLAYGVLAAVQAGGGRDDLATLRRFADRVVAPDGTFTEPLQTVEQAMIGPVLLELARRDTGTRYRLAAAGLKDFLLRQHVRTATGTLPYSPEEKDVLLVDTLPMVCPFLAGAAGALDAPDAASLAVRQLAEFQERAVDVATGLPWHAYRADGGPAYGALGWTRGAGWYAVALAETLAALPADHAGRAPLAAALERVITAAAGRQLPDGLWRWCLSIPEGGRDTSGSALLAWAIERGCGSRVLPETYRPVGRRAMQGVLLHIDQHGTVGQALGECQAVGHYPRVFGAYPWAQGPANAMLSWTQADPAPATPGR